MSNAPAGHPDAMTAPPLRRRGNRLYLAIWALLGCSAAVYLTLIALGRPLPLDSIADITGLSGSTDTEPTVALRRSTDTRGSGDTGQQWARLSREIETLKDNVTTVAQNVAQLSAGQQQTTERVSRLEAWQSVVINGDGNVAETIRTGAASSSNIKSVKVAAATNDAESDSTIEGTTIDGVTRTTVPQPSGASTDNDAAILAALLGNDPEAAAALSGNVPAPAPAPVQKVEEPAPAPIAAVVPLPGRRTFGVELGSGDSVDSLRLTWALLNERHRDLIGSLAPRYIQSGSGQTEIYRLIAGPFKSSKSARELCTQLQAYYVTCQTSAFTGSVL